MKPMSLRSLLLAFCVASGPALAQTEVKSDAPAGSVSPDDERARVRAERVVIEDQFLQEERACYQKFAVNDCIGAARVVRREGVADLRRQELAINAAEARRRGAEQITKTEQRTSPQAMREAEERLLDAQASQESRLRSMQDRAAVREKLAQEQAENRRIFEEKQEEARKRRLAQPSGQR